MSGIDDTIERATAGDLVAQRLLVLANLESVPAGAPVSIERIGAALDWARVARASGNAEDAMRLFWTLVRRTQYDDAIADDRLTERIVGEAIAALTDAAFQDDAFGTAAREMMPNSVCAMRAGAVIYTRLFLQQWGVPAGPFESVLAITMTPSGNVGPGDEAMGPSAEQMATAAAHGMLASKVAERFDIEWNEAIKLVWDAPDAAEKLRTPFGWREIVEQIGERVGAPAAAEITITVN